MCQTNVVGREGIMKSEREGGKSRPSANSECMTDGPRVISYLFVFCFFDLYTLRRGSLFFVCVLFVVYAVFVCTGFIPYCLCV